MKTFHKIIFLVVLLYCTYRAIEQAILIYNYSTNLGHPDGVFGYPVSVGWTYLVLAYWLAWITGISFVFASKRIGWLLVMPVALMGLIYIGMAVIKERGDELIEYAIQLTVLAGFMFLINQKTIFQALHIEAKGKYYAAATLIFLLFSSLFLLIDQYA